MANNPIVNMFRIKELRNRLLFTLAILAIFRLGCVLTIPGINAGVLVEYFNNLAKSGENAFASYPVVHSIRNQTLFYFLDCNQV